MKNKTQEKLPAPAQALAILKPEQKKVLDRLFKKAQSERGDMFTARNFLDAEEGFELLASERAMQFYDDPSDENRRRLFEACAAVDYWRAIWGARHQKGDREKREMDL